MFHLYILKSKNLSKYYIGITGDIEKRLTTHNNGRVKSTKYARPWKLIYKESYPSLREARKRELYLKSLKKRKALEKLMKHF